VTVISSVMAEMLSAGENRAPLDMPRMGGHAGVGHTQKRVHRHSSDFQAITFLRFYVCDDAPDRGKHGLLLIKTEDSRLYLPGHEKKGPPCQADPLLKFGTNVRDRGPASRIGLAFEPEGLRQKRAVFDQNSASLDCGHL
jgi:hypothetical protein